MALYLEGRTIHERNKTCDQFRLGLSKFLAVRAIDGDIAECRSAVILHVRVHGVQQTDQYRDSTRIDKLLSILIYMKNLSIADC